MAASAWRVQDNVETHKGRAQDSMYTDKGQSLYPRKINEYSGSINLKFLRE
ncbi:hypothetical protein GCM10009108_22130 [Castellaniella ginsengisoli]|uniref:Uncharacterized protein n=1 Tax=Castellaniella ginsengisoli TaxID=546114 RepID=A0ABP3W9T5_9BURK